MGCNHSEHIKNVLLKNKIDSLSDRIIQNSKGRKISQVSNSEENQLSKPLSSSDMSLQSSPTQIIKQLQKEILEISVSKTTPPIKPNLKEIQQRKIKSYPNSQVHGLQQ